MRHSPEQGTRVDAITIAEIMNLQIRLGEILREFEVTKLTLHIYTEKEFEFRVVFENRELAEKTLGRIINFIKSSFIKRFSETGKIAVSYTHLTLPTKA